MERTKNFINILKKLNQFFTIGNFDADYVSFTYSKDILWGYIYLLAGAAISSRIA